MVSALRRTAADAPDRTAIIWNDRALTYGELETRVNQLSRALAARGIGPAAPYGPGVALLCSNRPEFVEVIYACEQAGIRLTPINWHLTAEEVAYIVKDCDARALIVEAPFLDDAVAAIDGAEVPVRIAIGRDTSAPVPAGFEQYEEVIANESGAPLDTPVLGSRMFYTSGTTGRPKGVLRDLIATTAEGLAALGRIEGGKSVALVTGPLYHAAPLAINLQPPVAVGATVVLADRFDPEEFLRVVEAHRVSHTHLVPTMFHRLLALAAGVRSKYDVSSLRYVVHGAAPCPVHVKRAMIDWLGPIVHEYYAATEGGSVSISAAEWLEKPGSVGKPVLQRVEIRDEVGTPCRPNDVGTVYFERPEAAHFEYFNDRAKTASSYDASGHWFTMGDLGYLDDDGYLFLTGRTAEVVISGGVNIYPAEIDAVLLMHPAVADAAAVGVPHEEWGEEVMAVVELCDGSAGSPDLAKEILEFCRAHLAHFKCPRSVDFVDVLPRSEAGKVLRTQVRDRYRR